MEALVEIDSQVEQRQATVRRRRAPGQPVRLRLPFSDPVTIRDDSPIGPLELDIEPTNADGEFATWLDDGWWAEAITHWADDDVTVRIAPTPGALTHPVLAHQLDMLRRVVPAWRLVGYAFKDEVNPDTDAAHIAASPFHEIRFMDEPRPGRPRSDRVQTSLALPVLFSRIRTAQAQRRALTPILVRLPSSKTGNSPECSFADVVSVRPTVPQPAGHS